MAIIRRRSWAIALTTCFICLILSGSPFSTGPVTATVLTAPVAQTVEAALARLSPGLTLEKVGTPEVYFSRQGKPLLSFGGMSDFIFYAAPDAFDYERWADWAAGHGMNHVRAYPPMSWRFIEKFARDNGGLPDNLRFPYRETSPGSRQFDLSQFDEAYWQRFRQQCEYLQSKGIVIHLLMVNGWQLEDNDRNWGGHFFNPDNNINSFTDALAGDRLGFYHSVASGNTGLVDAQQAWFRKMVEATADLDNVYYDLVHEIAENHQDWEQAKAWITTMAEAVRSQHASFQSELPQNHPIILGMDTGGLEKRQREWIFSQPYFDVLIYGKKHTVAQARAWRDRYNKPYIPQESWDDDGTKYTLRNPDDRVHLRKYLWKFMMAKCQQMDIYARPLSSASPAAGQSTGSSPDYAHNYDPTTGRVPFENDAKVLRQLWARLTDYGNLGFNGRVQSGPGKHQFVLSSNQEGLVYLSSDTRQQGVLFEGETLRLRNLALSDGGYLAQIIRPDAGISSTVGVVVSRGYTTVLLPSFTDDLAVHFIREGEPLPASPEAPVAPQANSVGFVRRLVNILIATVLAIGFGIRAKGLFKKRRNLKKD